MYISQQHFGESSSRVIKCRNHSCADLLLETLDDVYVYPYSPSLCFNVPWPSVWGFVEVGIDSLMELKILRFIIVLAEVILTLLVMNWLSKRLIRAVRRCAKEIRLEYHLEFPGANVR